MYHYPVQSLDQKRMYKMFSGSLIPRPIGWITTLNQETQVVNAAPYSFTSGVSDQLPILSMAILRKNGKQKHTAANLSTYGEGVVHIVSSDMVHKMNETSASLDALESEIEKAGLSLVDSSSVQTPGIKEARIRMEVTVYQHIPVADKKGEIITDLFLLEVTDFYFDERVFDPEQEYIDVEALDPVARLAGPMYAELAKQYKIIRPE